MATRNGKAAIRWSGVELTAKDLLLEAKLSGGTADVRDLAARRAFAQKASGSGITVTDEAVNERFEELIADRELFDESQLAAWLESMKLSECALRSYCRDALLAGQWQDAIASEVLIREQFLESRLDYTRAFVEIAVVESEGAAHERLLATRESEIPWSFDDTRVVTRADAPEEISCELFSAEPGELLGPLESEDNHFEIWKLTALKPAVLDGSLSTQIREELIRRQVETLLPPHELEYLE